MSQARSLNRVILVGRVGRDPEITHIPSLGKDVAKFGLATTEVYMDKNQQWQEITEWHNLVAWDWNAKKVEKSVTKGIMLLVEGRLKTRKWQDKDTGQNRRATEIVVESLVPLEKVNAGLGGRDTSSPYNNGGGPQYPQQQPMERNYYQNQSPPPPQEPPSVQIDDIPYDETNDPF